MNLLAKDSGGNNIVAREGASARWYPAASVDGAMVRVGWHYADEPVDALTELGVFPAGARIPVPYTSEVDRNIVARTIAIAPSGKPSVSNWADALTVEIPFKREVAAPVIGQVEDATNEDVMIGVSGFGPYARKQRLRYAESLDGDGNLVNPTVSVFDAAGGEVPKTILISRMGALVPDYEFNGGDPATQGWTKRGSALTEISSAGWRINSSGTDAVTYYSKDDFPSAPFDAGLTIELLPPDVAATEAGAPDLCVALSISTSHANGFVLAFDASEVTINGGVAHAHVGGSIRLVVAAGGDTADLWIGNELVEDEVGQMGVDRGGLLFGDLAGGMDADAVWKRLAYAMTPVPVRLAQTIYVTVAHSSGNAYGAESDVLPLTFASDQTLEGAGGDGSPGTFDPEPRHKVVLEELT